MATSKQLQAKLDKLKTKIETRQNELKDLKEQQKGLKEDLAEAKSNEKTKGKVGSKK